MDPERWRRAREIFDELVDLEPPERDARLASACGDDPEIRLEVESLLAHDRPAHDSIERVVAEAALEIAGEDAQRADTTAIPSAIGRYRVLAKIGEGGMGEVFLAEDTSLGRRVALKLPSAAWSGDPRAWERLQREARAAATLNHPNVCVVHEVVEGPGKRPFIAMEYVAGETLAARIERERLPVPDVLALGEQAAGALHEAHSKGIVHRDLKPSNIVLTPHGIKLLDFGLASVVRDAMFGRDETSAGMLTGTIPYMSPEQVRSEDVDARTDLFSLGVVLYEAATGRRPFEGATPRATSDAILHADPTPASEIVRDLPRDLDRVISKALAKNREERYQTAAELREDLAHCARTGKPERGRARSFLGAFLPRARRARLAVTLVAGMTALGIGYGLRARSPALPGPAEHAVLIADFDNTTRDPTFDGTLKEALLVQLQQTPFLHVFPDAGVRETLRQMTRAPSERVTPDVAREICQRRGVSVWIAGSIAPLARGYAITVTAMSGRSGATLAHERMEVDGKAQVLSALGVAANRVRRTLGESLQSIQTFSAPIEQATTGSLDALKAYALGVEQGAQGNYPVAVSLYERAVQIDPEFALAHQALAREQLNSGYSQLEVTTAATRAYALREHATEQEALRIAAFYHSVVTGDLERAIEAGELWRKTYPLDWRPHHALGDLYTTTAQFEQAVDAAREAVRLNPDVAAAYSNLAGSLFALDRFDEARNIYRQAVARGLDAPEYHAFLWRIAYYTNDVDGMREQLDWASASASWALNMPSLSAALQGRWREARRRSSEATAFFERRGMTGFVALAARYEAMTGALVGDCDAAIPSAKRTIELATPADDQARAMVALALCGETGPALSMAARLSAERPMDTMVNRIWVPVIRAATFLDRQRPEQTIDILQATVPYEGAAESVAIYLRGLALLHSGDGARAGIEFQKILDHRGRTFWFPFYPLAHIGLARAAAMSGDAAAASRAYRELFVLWKEADPDLPVLVEARQEYERLTSR